MVKEKRRTWCFFFLLMASERKGSSRQPETGLPPRCEPQLSIPAPHIESFDYFLEKGLPLAVRDLQPVEIEFPDLKSYLTVWINSVSISTPCHSAFDQKLYPSEVRRTPRPLWASPPPPITPAPC